MEFIKNCKSNTYLFLRHRIIQGNTDTVRIYLGLNKIRSFGVFQVDIKRLSDGVIAKSDLQYKNKYILSLKRRKKIVKIDPKTSFNTL